jgi:hypothetical protein
MLFISGGPRRRSRPRTPVEAGRGGIDFRIAKHGIVEDVFEITEQLRHCFWCGSRSA